MNRKSMHGLMTIALGVSLWGGTAVWGQASGAQTTPAQTDKDKTQTPPAAAPLTLDTAPAPVSADEDAAMKAFRAMPPNDVAKKDQAGEAFLQKYPQSRYRSEVYSWLVKGYLSAGEVDKMEAAGDKELEITPNDAQTLAIVGSTLPRAMNGSMSDAERQKRLDKAELFSKKALEIVPTYAKPDNTTDEQFTAAKNQTMALAYSGLGVVAFRRGKYPDAVTNLEQSVKLDPNPDPVSYYLLGISNAKASHFDDAIAAFTKCAATSSGVQAMCKSGIDDAKKASQTQLSAPK
jgi:tetratricopeptide (TPR) repeat protein